VPGGPDPHRPTGERLQKVLAAAGVASRRAAEEMIAAGRVSVNGSVVTTLGTRVDPGADRIAVDGRRISTDPDKIYVVLNKPAGVVTTMSDERGRQSVAELVRAGARVFPVGRLDADTQGLLLMTNDGELAHRLTHPRWGVERVYRAEVLGALDRAAVDRLLRGVRLDDGEAKAIRVRVVAKRAERSHLEIVMGEGRKREVRRMLEAVGHPVVRLVRRAYGPIRLGTLRPGAWRELTSAEVGALKQLVDL
jgi:pseudouridine synthase